jgi:FdhE protein
MVNAQEQITQQIARFKKERPLYQKILDLYALVVEEQGKIRPLLKITVTKIDDGLVTSRFDKGLPLMGQEGFAVDLEAALQLFHALSTIAERATPRMSDEIPKIIEAAAAAKLDLRDLLSRHAEVNHLNHEAERCALDKGILSFLIQASIRPSIEAQREQLQGSLNLEAWSQGRCPLCGSPPQMATLRDEGGKRYLYCSFCGLEWRGERIACPYCDNKAFDSLQYLYVEDEDAYRVDLCDSCKGYLKTVDARKLAYKPVLDLEDIVTIHLDIVAMEKGYQRPVPAPWGPLTASSQKKS